MKKVNKIIINTLMTLLVFASSGFLFSCDNNSSSISINVNDNDKWDGKCYLGSSTPKFNTGKVNDFYVNSNNGDIYIKVNEEEWDKITDVNSLPYKYENKWELHIDHEGYFYVNEINTQTKVKDYLSENIIENTLQLKDNKFFGSNKTVSVNNPLIMMGNYKKMSKITHYNELLVEQVTTYVNKVGALEFGTYNLKTKEYKRKFKVVVNKGKNVIKLNMQVGYNETLAIGGDESNVSLYLASNIKNNDQNGLFSRNLDTLKIEEDRLILEVKAKTKSLKSNFPNVSVYEKEDISKYTIINYEGAPIILKDYEKFEGKTISKFKFPIDKVKALSDKYILTVSVLSQEYLKDNKLNKHIIKEYPLDITSLLDNPKDVTLSKWIEVDVSSLNIKIEDGQMLGFGKNTDNALLCIDRTVHNNEYPEFNFYLPYYRETLFVQNVFLDVFTNEYISLEGHLENINSIERKYAFKDKNISIFGDSISSYAGYSNDTSVNSTLGSNGSHYTGSSCNVTDVNQTWWMSLINKLDANLLVNNSSAGDAMYLGGFNRCVQLHNNDGVNPDVICMFFGINDVWRSQVTLDDFKVNYPKIIKTIKEKYPNTPIYAATYIPFTWWSGGDKNTVYHKTSEELEQYNNVVRNTLKDNDNCYLVDLFNDSGITYDNYKNYCHNEGDRWLHPNPSGMELISNTFYQAMMDSLK